MNNRYFGNIHDFYKYSLLRLLAENSGLSLGVCWMLTRDDGGAGGGYAYLENPIMEKYDRDVFHFLREKTDGGVRGGVADLQAAWLPHPAVNFFDRPLPSMDLDERERYFGDMLDLFNDQGLIFLDPDSGIYLGKGEPSPHRRERYVSCEEIAKCYKHGAGHSILFYQDYRPDSPDANRDYDYKIRRLLCDFSDRDKVYLFEGRTELLGRSASAVGRTLARFFLLPHRNHVKAIEGFVKWFNNSTAWAKDGQFSVRALRPRIGIFVDDQNFNQIENLKSAHKWIGAKGDVIDRRAFGDEEKMGDRPDEFYNDKEFSIIPVRDGENQADLAIYNAVVEALRKEKLDIVCVLAGDRDYQFLASAVKSQGILYWGFAAERQPVNKHYPKECTKFFRVPRDVTND